MKGNGSEMGRKSIGVLALMNSDTLEIMTVIPLM